MTNAMRAATPASKEKRGVVKDDPADLDKEEEPEDVEDLADDEDDDPEVEEVVEFVAVVAEYATGL